VPGMTVADYVLRWDAIEAQLKTDLHSIEVVHDACMTACDIQFPPPDTGSGRTSCVSRCDTERNNAETAARIRALQAHEELEDEARHSGLLLNILVIVDTALIADLKKFQAGSSFWAGADVMPVKNAAELKAAMLTQHVYRSLMLFTAGENGLIRIGTDLVSLSALAALLPLMRVELYVEVRGPSDGVPASYGQSLRIALGAEEFGDHWEHSGATISISIDSSDFDTRRILSWGDDFWYPTRPIHFVAVGDQKKSITLTATVSPWTMENESAVSWSASGGRIKRVKNRPLTITISRKDPKKIVVQAKLKQATATVLVWVIWCELDGWKSTGQISNVDGQPLGLRGGRHNDPFVGWQYAPEARIDWVAKIKPAEILTDDDRPAIAGQPPMATFPGAPRPDPGWEIAGQLREMTDKREGFRGAVVREREAWWGPVQQISHDVTNPYYPWPPFAANVRSIRYFTYLDDHKVGSFEHVHAQGRAHVRVLLGYDWFRCSAYKYWRWHYFAKKTENKKTHALKWGSEAPSNKDVLELDSQGY
jgi:hypothetical protein